MGEGDSMVRTSLAIKREVEDTRNIRDMDASVKKKENQSSFSSRKKQKTSVSHGSQGQGRVGASSQTGQMTCYHCHNLEHMRRDCPRRHGSQNYGTVQSQSLVGQARTQFVPSHPVQAKGPSISLRVLHRHLLL